MICGLRSSPVVIALIDAPPMRMIGLGPNIILIPVRAKFPVSCDLFHYRAKSGNTSRLFTPSCLSVTAICDAINSSVTPRNWV